MRHLHHQKNRNHNKQPKLQLILLFLLILSISLLTLTIPPLAEARYGRIAALSVDEETQDGSVAEMVLEIKPGSGSTYIESSPLTRLDTQMSARMARAAACKLSTVDCSRYDFFYVIQVPSSVIGGPSAGGALAVLTYAVLEDLPIRNDTAMTGAILSGEIIGPVGSVNIKVTAAANEGFSSVVVPTWEPWTQPAEPVLLAVSSYSPRTNNSREINYSIDARNSNEQVKQNDDLQTYGVPLGDAADSFTETLRNGKQIKVIPVATLSDAIKAFTGTEPKTAPPLNQPPADYTTGMKKVATLLCTRRDILASVVEAVPAKALYSDFLSENTDTNSQTAIKTANSIANNKNSKTTNTIANNSDYYNTNSSNNRKNSADKNTVELVVGVAPRSIGKLIESSDELYLRAQNASLHGEHYTAASLCFGSNVILEEIILRTSDKAARETVFSNAKRDAQGVREAIDKAQIKTISDLEITMISSERLADVERELEKMDADFPSAQSLAYANERLETARAWLSLLGTIDGAPVKISEDDLYVRCRTKLDDAQERVNYVSILYPDAAIELQVSLRDAFGAAQRGQSALCLLQASQAKAEANAVLTAIYVPAEAFPLVLAAKRTAAHEAVAAMNAGGSFPILGYSYIEYADELVPRDNATASLYAEYSLELASLPIYFPRERTRIRVDTTGLIIFFLGAGVGILIGLLIMHTLHRNHTLRVKERKVKNNK